MRKHIYILCFLTGIALLLCACGVSENSFTDYSQYLKPASGNTGSPVPAPAPGDDFSSVVAVVATPAPTAQLPVNTPAPTSTPGPFQTTPAPAEKTPVPTPQQNLVQITKSPTSETVQAGGSAVFIAYADNSTGIVWITVSPDAKTAYDINNAVTAFPSLQVSGQGTSVLTLSNIPYEMEEAACIDGSGIYRTAFTIILPMMVPALITAAIFVFLQVWNELLLASLFTTDNVRTLTVGIKQMSGQYQTDYGSMGAGLVIATLPTLILYMCMSSQVQKSLVAGAVKG